MKTFQKNSLFIVALCVLAFSLGPVISVSAQDRHMEEVVYLKDGSIYRGIIIEQVPGKSLKIQTVGGNVFAVQMEDVEKMTKEAKVRNDGSDRPHRHGDQGFRKGHKTESHYRKGSDQDSTRRSFEYRRKGYFFQSQILIEALQGGIRIVNGYKFGRFGYLGVGIGIDAMGYSVLGEDIIGHMPSGFYEGAYLPLYLYHQGDFLAKRFTPFYAVEAGYAMAYDGPEGPFSDGNSGYRKGGWMGGLGVGMKFGTRRRLHFSLLLNVNVKQVTYQENYYDLLSSYVPVTTRIVPQAGLRFGIGF